MACFVLLIASLPAWTKLRISAPQPLISNRGALRRILGCSSVSHSSRLSHRPPVCPATSVPAPHAVPHSHPPMPSSLLHLEGNPNKHRREPVQRNLGCPFKRHDTIYNVSHKNADLDAGHNLGLQMEHRGLQGDHAVFDGEGPCHCNSSVFCPMINCPLVSSFPSLWASPIQSWLPFLSHQTRA